jgi:DNA-binding response OmpR family regulator
VIQGARSWLIIKLFLVDDALDIVTALKKGLEKNGFQVDAFTDPKDALANYATARLP